ncbi:MAG: DUF1592 domain-containing protein [Alphaproteobacteria bacterium]|nr:DUF1592 domain-containing protein [Alphaproteobacteria bacterium]
MFLLAFALACQEPATPAADSGVSDRGEAPASSPAPPSLKRLTGAQYRNSMHALFGEGVLLPNSVEADERIEGLFAVGSAYTTISSYGVEKYEKAAYDIAEQVMDDDELRARWVPCTPVDVQDDDCAAESLETLGRLAWRRPLSADELEVLVLVSAEAAVVLDDFHDGLEFGFAALLMSPNFLYRVELGDGLTGGGGSYTGAYDDYEMASRLSFFLWDSIPDAELLDAAAAGELTNDAGLLAQVDRMLADDRVVDGVRNLFTEMLHLDELDDLNKDPTIFTYMSDDLAESAREETLLGIEALVFDDDASYLDLYTTQRTFLDRTLAAVYDVPAPEREGFGEVWLADDGGRRGFLGQASFLALNAHATSTSVTRRGIFIREVVLCQPIPDPPANANTAIPEVAEDAPTMRERIAVHLENPECATCHELTDPIGLGFENFDGLGRWRLAENGATIDPSGELDGGAFTDAWTLGQVVADHPQTGPCMTQTMLQYATGNVADDLDETLVDWHTDGFSANAHRILWLMRDVALSPAFREVGEIQ